MKIFLGVFPAGAVGLMFLLSEILHAEAEFSSTSQAPTLMTNVTERNSTQGNSKCSVDKTKTSGSDAEHRLIEDLMRNYNLDARPVFNKSTPVEVKFDLAFNQIVELDGRRQTLRSKVWLRQFWTNPYLTWNSSDYCDLKFVVVNSKKIWKPDVVLYNSIGQDAAIYNRNYMIKIHSNGFTEWYLPAEISSICQIDIKNFPFDSQQCKLKFGSWAYTGGEVNLLLKAGNTADLAAFTENGEWELVSMPAKRHSIKYTCCPNPYVDITYTIHLKRRVLFYLNNLIIPCIILAALTTLSFYLPPESGERVSLVITVLLGLTVFMLLYNESIPPTSESMPLIGKYFFAILVEVTSSLVITCFIMRCYHHNPFKEMPGWFRYLIFTVLAPVLRMDFPKRTQKIEERRRPSQSRLVPHNKHVYTALPSVPNGKFSQWNNNTHHSPKGSQISLEKVSMDQHEEKLECISQQVDILLDYFDNEQKVDVKRDEWHFASIVLDQVFFYLFVITIVFSVIAFYTMIPE